MILGDERNNISVFYVDDEEILLDAGRLYLEHTGNFSVEICNDAVLALNILAEKKFDAIISDYQMPGMDGIEFLQKLRGRGDNTPFIIFTGRGREEVVIDALNSGADFYMQKGGEPKSQFAELQHKIRRSVRSREYEATIRESEKKYRDIVEYSPNFIYTYDSDNRFMSANRSLCEFLGKTEEEIIGKKHSKLDFPKETYEYIYKLHDAVYRTKDAVRAESSFKMPDGKTYYYKVVLVPVFDSDGFVVGIRGNNTDITNKVRAERELIEKNNELLKVNENLAAAEEELKQQLDEIITAENKLLKSNKYLNSLIESANVPTIVWDMDLTITRFNHAFEELTGISADEALGKNLRMLYPDDSAESSLNTIRKSMSGDRLDNTEIPILHKSDAVRCVIWNSSNIMEGDRLVSSIAQGEDITERKEAEIRLKNSENKFKQFFENMSCGVAVYKAVDDGRDFVFVDFNRASEEIDGIKREDVIGKSITEVFPEAKDYGLFEILRDVWESGESQYNPAEMYRDDRISGWRENRVYKVPSGLLVAVYNDVTELKKAEEALKISEEKFRSYIENAPEGILILDDEGRYIDVNQTACDITGYSCDELFGMKIGDLSPPEFRHKTVQHFNIVAEEGRHENEIVLRQKDGRDIHAYFKAVTLKNGNYMAFYSEITKNKSDGNE